jgi:3-oxoacyl-[acyl-carrier-protein] synthase-3
MTLRLVGTGSYLPEKILSNDHLSKTVDTSHQWIFERTGISQRHIASDLETCAFMAGRATERALKSAELLASDIDLIIVASCTSDQTFPSIACEVQRLLSFRSVPAFDLQAVCAGFVCAISVASAFAKDCSYSNILVIGTERMSSIVDWSDRSTCVLFGDGAGAAIFRKSSHQVIDSITYTDGSLGQILYTSGGVATPGRPNYIRMNGREVFKHGVQKMTSVAQEILQKNNLKVDDIAYFVPHQANARIIDFIAQKLNIPENKIVKTTNLHANCSAASIPLALDHLFKTSNLENGLILTVGFGAGVTWGANLISLGSASAILSSP